MDIIVPNIFICTCRQLCAFVGGEQKSRKFCQSKQYACVYDYGLTTIPFLCSYSGVSGRRTVHGDSGTRAGLETRNEPLFFCRRLELQSRLACDTNITTPGFACLERRRYKWKITAAYTDKRCPKGHFLSNARRGSSTRRAFP